MSLKRTKWAVSSGFSNSLQKSSSLVFSFIRSWKYFIILKFLLTLFTVLSLPRKVFEKVKPVWKTEKFGLVGTEKMWYFTGNWFSHPNLRGWVKKFAPRNRSVSRKLFQKMLLKACSEFDFGSTFAFFSDFRRYCTEVFSLKTFWLRQIKY